MNQNPMGSGVHWTDTRRIGAFAAFGLAVSPILAIVVSFAASAAGERSDPVNGLDFVIKQPVLPQLEGAVTAWIAASFMVLALALDERLHKGAAFAARIGTAAGVIGSALLVTDGIATISLPARMAALNAQNHEAAVAAFAAFRIIGGFLFTAGLVMFGVFVFVASAVGARSRQLPRPLSYLGILLGVATIVSGVGILAGPLGVVSLVLVVVWPVWLGIALLRSEPQVAPPPREEVQPSGDIRPAGRSTRLKDKRATARPWRL